MNKVIRISIIVGAMMLNSSPVFSAEPVPAVTEDVPITNFEDTDDVSSMLADRIEKYSFNPELISKGYTFGQAMLPFDGDLKAEAAADDFYLTYKIAVANAVSEMIMQETFVALSSKIKANLETSKGDQASNIDSCKKDYREKIAAAEVERKRQAESFMGQVERIVDKFAPIENLDRQAVLEKEKDALDSVISCEAIGDPKELVAMLSTSVNGSMQGIRTMETIVQGPMIGVIVGRSGETAKLAGMLKGKRKVSEPLATAAEEALAHSKSFVQDFQSQNQQPPFGLIGVRAKKLSNGEFALIGYGVAERSTGNSLQQNFDKSMSQRSAQNRALTALNEFAYMTVSQDFNDEIKKKLELVIVETVDLASKNGGDVEGYTDSLQSSMRAVLKEAITAVSEGSIPGIKLAGTRSYKGGNDYPNFYLSTVLWSPSIMSMQLNKGASNRESFEEGKKFSDAKGNAGSKQSGQSSGSKTTVFKVKEDW